MDGFVSRHVDMSAWRAEFAHRLEQENIYLLLDGGSLKGCPVPEFPAGKDFLLLDTPFEALMGDGGLFFELEHDSPWMPWLESADACDKACIIASPLERAALVAHLKTLCSAVTPGSEKQLLFRFYEPRNLEVLLTSFTLEEKSIFLGPFSLFAGLRTSQKEKCGLGEWFIVENPNAYPAQFIGPWVLSLASMAALEELMWSRIIDQVEQGVCRYADTGRELRLLGSEGAKILIASAIEAANLSGIFHINEYTQQAKWMLRFGEHFRTDIQFPWVSLTPKDETPQEEWSRIQLMADECHEAIYADNYRAYQDFVKRLWLLNYQELSRIGSEADIFVSLSNLWPEKFAVLHEDGLRSMIARARGNATDWQLDEPFGTAIVSGVYFICGVDAFNSLIRYPWLAKTQREMLLQPRGQRSAWLFQKLRRRIESMYRPYRLPAGEEKRQAQHFARKRVEDRVAALTLQDLQKATHAQPFYQKMFPEQFQAVEPQRRNKVAKDSLLLANAVVERYGIHSVIPLIGLFFFTRFLRTTDYSINIDDHPYIQAIMEDYEIDKVDPAKKAEYAFEFLRENFNTVALPAPPHWPQTDLYKSIIPSIA